jgi:hypothetical protein
MDHGFLKIIVESFCFSNDLNYEKVGTVYLEELKEISSILQNTNIELFRDLVDNKQISRKVLESYLKQISIEDKILTEDLVIVPSIVGLLAAYALFRKPIKRGYYKIMKDIGEYFESVGDKLKTRGRYYIFRYEIIQKNLRDCYIKCGFDPNDVKIDPNLFSKIGDETHSRSSKENFEKADCLQRCYVEGIADIIVLKTEDYLTCLKITGNFGAIDNSDKDKLMTILSTVHLIEGCNVYRDELKVLFSRFDDLMGFIGKSEDNILLVAKAREMLKEKIFAAKKRFSGYRDNDVNRIQNFGKKKFDNSKKYR